MSGRRRSASGVTAQPPTLPSTDGTLQLRNRWFADSLLEEGVSSEPVSEVGGNGTTPRRLWMITEAEKGYFGLEYAEFLVFPLGSFSRSLRS
jgi:hypothetical protein